MRLVAAIAFAASLSSFAGTEQLIPDLAQSREWRVLLHERTSLFGQEHSEADGPGFFLSPEGKTDAEAELRADLDAFRDSTATLQVRPVACRFPARFRFLRDHLDSSLRAPSCPDFERWKAQFHARSLTVVYAAPYLGSPASMFGHTFLKLRSPEGPPLDPSISFEAATGPDAGGPLLAIKGLLGFYPGVFSLQPYHLKLSLYSNLEARDLWEYELTLTPAEIDRMLDHAWELGSTYFSYYFFNANCSYQLLSLIEAARPTLELREHFHEMTVPADTLRVLRDVPGLVQRVTRRPSLIAELEARLNRLSPAELDRFLELRDHLEQLKHGGSPALLDALLDWAEYRVVLESKTLFDAEHRVPLALLRERAAAGPATPPAFETAVSSSQNSSDTPPDEGHPTTRVFGGGGAEQGRGFARLEFRPVLHDMMDDDSGYLPNSRLLIGDTTLEYQTGAGEMVRLQDLTLAEVETLPRWDTLFKPFSWQIGGGLVRPEDTGCVACLAGSFRAAGGLALGEGSLTGYAFARGDLQASSVFSPFFRVGPSALLGGFYSPAHSIKLHVELGRTWFTDDVTYWRTLAEAQVSLSKSVTVQAAWEKLMGNSGVVDPNRLFATLGYGF